MLTVLLVGIVVAALDLVSKLAVMATMVEGQSIPVIQGVLTLHFIRNPGAAYGFLLGKRWVLATLAALVSGGLVWYARQTKLPQERIGLGLILGGAIGNLHNRVAWGAVTDLIEIDPLSNVFLVFNLADVAITAGILLLLWTAFRQHKERPELT